MSATWIVPKRTPGRRGADAAARNARDILTVRHYLMHECGMEAVEALALVAAILALLAVISLIFRDHATDVGSAATATLTRWFTAMPGVVSVGNPDAITAAHVMPLHHTVVSLPQLLIQALDEASPGVERVIWIAGSLLATAVAWRVAMHPALRPVAGWRFSPAETVLRWMFEQVVRVLHRTHNPAQSTILNSTQVSIASTSHPPLPPPDEQSTDLPNIPAGAGAGITAAMPPPLPRGAPPVNMSDRHILSNLNFWKAVKEGGEAGNSYLIEALSDSRLNELYREAFAIGPKRGPVTLSNGQTWFIEKATGKFFPMRGSGIVNLTQQEVRLLEMLSKQIIREGVSADQALKNLSRAMGGQKYTITEHMQTALSRLTTRLGYSADDLSRAIAPHLPASATIAMPAEATAAAQAKAAGRAFRFVRWGGRVLLVIGLAMDAYEVYYAENKPKTITKKIGGWGASLVAGGVTAKVASSLLAGGPWGWVGYGAAVIAAGVGGYIIGEKVTETIYEWIFE